MLLPTTPQAILIDLADVLRIDDEPLPGAVDALVASCASALPIRFLTDMIVGVIDNTCGCWHDLQHESG